MIIIEVTYSHHEGGWFARSRDMQHRFEHGLAAGDDTYAKTRATVEEVVPWALGRDDVEIEHFVEESAIVAYLAERDAAASEQKTAA